jgi:hypothetical protein
MSASNMTQSNAVSRHAMLPLKTYPAAAWQDVQHDQSSLMILRWSGAISANSTLKLRVSMHMQEVWMYDTQES